MYRAEVVAEAQLQALDGGEGAGEGGEVGVQDQLLRLAEEHQCRNCLRDRNPPRPAR